MRFITKAHVKLSAMHERWQLAPPLLLWTLRNTRVRSMELQGQQLMAVGLPRQ